MRSLRVKIWLAVSVLLLILSVAALKLDLFESATLSSLLALIVVVIALIPLSLLINRLPKQASARWLHPLNRLRNRIEELPERRQVNTVLVSAVVVGLGFGLLQPCIQVAVEQGQVLAGIVRYSPDNAFYIYQVRAWNLWAQLAAVGLRLGLSDIVISLLLSAIGGILAITGFALILLAVAQEPLFAISGSILCVLVIYILRLAHFAGYSYPIYLVGQPHTYGTLGLSFILLCLGFLAVGKYRTGFILLGLSVAAHPSLAIWTGLTTMICMLFEYKRWKEWLRYLPNGLAGAGASVASYLFQKLSYSIVTVDPLAAQNYLPTYLKYWDDHRAFPLEGIFGSSAGILLLLNAVVLGIAILAQKRSVAKESNFIGRFMIISAIVAVIFAIWSQSNLPLADVISILLPSRFLNLTVLLYAAALIGLMWIHRSEVWIVHTIVLTVLLLVLTAALPTLAGAISIFPLMIIVPLALIRKLPTEQARIAIPTFILLTLIPVYLVRQEVDNPVIWVGFVILIGMLCGFFLYSDPGLQLNQTFYRVAGLTPIILAGIILAAIFLQISYAQFIDGFASLKSTATLDPFWSEVAQGNGPLLTASSDFFMTQLRARRPVVADMGALDSLPYGIEGAPQVVSLLNEVYGIDFFNPPVKAQHKGALPALPQVKSLWETRSEAEWKQLARQYGFTGIVTYADWKLHLPIKAHDSYKVLYYVP